MCVMQKAIGHIFIFSDITTITTTSADIVLLLIHFVFHSACFFHFFWIVLLLYVTLFPVAFICSHCAIQMLVCIDFISFSLLYWLIHLTACTSPEIFVPTHSTIINTYKFILKLEWWLANMHKQSVIEMFLLQE